jgi:hypothetical protein
MLPLAVSGCGGDGRPALVKVTGTVLLDGAPVEGAIVMFQPDVDAKAQFRRPSAGVTDASGKFVLGTYEKDDGLPPGKYKVGIQKRELIGELPKNFDLEKPGDFNLKYKIVIPKKYTDPAASGLSAEVTNKELVPASFDLQSGGQKPEIEVSGPAARRGSA